MNPKDFTVRQISVMKAFAFEGRRIQCRRNYSPDDEWRDVIGVPGWNWCMCDYRVKEEPRTCYVGFAKDDMIGARKGFPVLTIPEDKYLEKKKFYDASPNYIFIKMVEEPVQ